MAGKKGQKKRFWSDDEKRSICGQARASGLSVAQVARRYSMNTNLIQKWLRDPRFVPNEDAGVVLNADEVAFPPVEIDAVPVVEQSASASSAPGSGLRIHRVDLMLSDGRREMDA